MPLSLRLTLRLRLRLRLRLSLGGRIRLGARVRAEALSSVGIYAGGVMVMHRTCIALGSELRP